MFVNLPDFVTIDADSFQPRRVGNLVRDEMDSGHIQQRPRNCKARREFSFSIVFHQSNRAEFENWFENEINQGSKPFYMDYYPSQETILARLTSNEYSEDLRGNKILITFDAEVY